MNSQYGNITVNDLINFVMSNPKEFPKKLDTPILTGDFEGNCMHGKHEILTAVKDNSVTENSVCLGYEEYENIYPW